VLFADYHHQFWEIVKQVQRQHMPAHIYEGVEMAQFAVWTTLADSGLGASLQHYNPLIDERVAEHFEIEKSWLLRAQLCFGSIEQTVEEKLQKPDQQRFKVFN